MSQIQHLADQIALLENEKEKSNELMASVALTHEKALKEKDDELATLRREVSALQERETNQGTLAKAVVDKLRQTTDFGLLCAS